MPWFLVPILSSKLRICNKSRDSDPVRSCLRFGFGFEFELDLGAAPAYPLLRPRSLELDGGGSHNQLGFFTTTARHFGSA
jgi:hypothetical protein